MSARPAAISGGFTASRLGQFSWAMLHFAAGPYWIMVNIFVFAAFFQSVVVGDVVQGQALWGYVQAAAGFIVALFSPVLGAIADVRGDRKPGLALFLGLALIAILGLWSAGPGAILWTGTAVIIAAVMVEFAGVFHNAMLPAIASEKRIGFLSGLGYSLDYAGAITVFSIWLVLPVSGLIPAGDTTYMHERIVGPLTAVWLAVFVTPLFLFTPDTPSRGIGVGAAARDGLQQLARTLRAVSHYRNIALYLVARAIYADGLSAVFAFIGVYVHGVFGWSVAKVGIYALSILVISAFTSVIGGWIDDRLGSKRTIAISLAGFSIGTALAIGVTPDAMFYAVPIPPALAALELPVLGPLFNSIGFTGFAEQLNLAFAMISGVFVGPMLASSRTMLVRIAPPERMAEFFGLFTLTGRATAWLAPLAIGIVTSATGDQRAGFSMVFVFLVAGFLMLLLVREERTQAV